MKKNYQKPTTTATAITSEKMIAASLTLNSDKRTGSQLGKEQDGGDWDNIWK